MKKKPRISKINSIHFGFELICLALITGVILPLVIKLVFHVFFWPLCFVGGGIFLVFLGIFAIEMHQDFGKIPYYRKHLAEEIPFDRESQTAIIKCSICNGEKVAGFKDRESGHFTEVMVIRSEEDLRFFKRIYGIEEIKNEY